jgi:recombination protein RecA
MKVVKNKVASPFREAEVDILFGEGISREGDLLDLGSEEGIVDKSGSWFSFAGERLGQGRETARTFLKEHPEIRGKIDTAVRQKIGLGKTEATPAKPVGSEGSKTTVAQSA